MIELIESSPADVQAADPEVLHVMAARGGSFVRQLGEAWMCADPTNSAKLMSTFRDYYLDYEARYRASWIETAKNSYPQTEFSDDSGNAFA